MDTLTINAELRSGTGKKANKDLRKERKVPAVIYGGDKNILFSAHTNEFKNLVYSPDFKVASINIDGKETKCILKDLQFHPVTDELEHLDFIELVDGKKVIVQIPIKLVGTSEGEKLGGKVSQLLRKLKIKTTPDKLTESLKLDISSLELGQAARVKDVEVAEGMEVINNESIPVVSVEVPRALKSAEAAEVTADATEGGDTPAEGGDTPAEEGKTDK